MRLLTEKRSLIILAIILATVAYSAVFGATDASTGEPDAGHGGPVMQVLIGLIVILLAAKLGGDLFERIGQPAVLGELVLGMIIGNLHLVGIDALEPFKHDVTLEVLAQIGVIILLFEVGLETTVKEMMGVGVASLLVAAVGVVLPFFLGWGVGWWFLPEANPLVHVFLGATLTATSVGITARVLKDIGKIETKEAKIILGAAVIDDILGLIVLAVVAGIIAAAASGSGEGIGFGHVAWIIGKALLFIVGAILIGSVVLPHYFKFGFKLKGTGVFLSFSLLVCFLLSFIAGEIGLAPIVGAFAAGLILDEVQIRDFTHIGKQGIEELVAPIGTFLVPVFFVSMGMAVDLTDLRTFRNPWVRGGHDPGGDCRKAGLRAGGLSEGARPVVDRTRDDPARRGRADFRRNRGEDDDRRGAGDFDEHLFRRGDYGDGDDPGDAAGPESGDAAAESARIVISV